MRKGMIAEKIESIKTKETISKISICAFLLLILFQKILFVPINVHISQATFSTLNIGADKISAIEGILPNILYVSTIFSTLFILLQVLCYAFILKLLFILFRITNINYKNILQILIFASFILIVGDYVNTIILYILGIESVTSQLDVYKIGLNLLFDPTSFDWSIYSLLSNINIFQFFYCVFLIWSLKILTRQSYQKMITIVFIYWLLKITIPIIFSNILMGFTQNALVSQ